MSGMLPALPKAKTPEEESSNNFNFSDMSEGVHFSRIFLIIKHECIKWELKLLWFV